MCQLLGAGTVHGASLAGLTGSPTWSRATVNVISYTCATPATVRENIYGENSLELLTLTLFTLNNNSWGSILFFKRHLDKWKCVVCMCVCLTALWEPRGAWKVPQSEWRRCSQINSCWWERDSVHSETDHSSQTKTKNQTAFFCILLYITKALSNTIFSLQCKLNIKQRDSCFRRRDYSQFWEVAQIEKHFRGETANPVVG